jgi:hypothetical protein
MAIIEYQTIKKQCLVANCGGTVSYDLSRTGPWMLKSDSATCDKCGTLHTVKLTVSADDVAHVTIALPT